MCTIIVVIIVKIVFIHSFLFYWLFLNHSFQINTQTALLIALKLFLFYYNYTAPASLSGLFALLATSGAKTQSDVFTAVAAIASVIQQKFSPFYTIFMPLALNVLSQPLVHAQTISQKNLRGRAMECVGVIAVAVKKEM